MEQEPLDLSWIGFFSWRFWTLPLELPSGGVRLPDKNVAESQLRFFVVGDTGRDNPTQRNVAASMRTGAAETKPHFRIHTGDIIYPNGVEGPCDPLLDSHLSKHYQGLGPMYLSLGNHDHNRRGSVAGTVDFANRDLKDDFELPARYYSFRYNFKGSSAEFFVLDTAVIDEDPNQRRWLAEALEASTADWQIMVGHHPMYSGGYHGPSNKMRQHVLGIARSGVQVYLSGHEHDQQVLQGPHGLIQVVSGTGASSRPTHLTPQSLYAGNKPGYAQVQIDADTIEVSIVDASNNTAVFSTTFDKAGRRLSHP